MAGNIKGIIVEIGGDTSALQKALSKVNSATASLSKELRGIESLLKLDPKNTELLAQKQAVLSENIAQTTERLKVLKEAQDKFIASGGDMNTSEYRNLQREIIATENKLKTLQVQASKWNQAGDFLVDFGNKITKVSDKVDKLGTTITTRLTLPIVAIGTAMVNSSKEFESAFTGVEKTVDGTAEQMERLKQGIKDMSEEIPSTTTEIAAVAETAGQLGIATEDILSFTRVMIDLGNSTVLSADEAASALAKFANITNMSAKDYDRLGATIVALGNNFSTTEADIVSMATRLAATGELTGLTEPQIMALATAMSSVGIEAEAGGSAMSKLLKTLQIAVETGGGKLQEFANVANMSSKDFQKAFKEDAIGALSSFIGGLNDVERNGKSAINILDNMGLTEIRLSNTILSLANANGLMNNAVKMANTAWEENTALTNEANKKYQNLESRIKMTSNKLRNLGITMGDKLTPMVNDILKSFDGLLDKLNGLSQEQTENIVKIGLFVAAIGPAVKILSTMTTTVGNVSRGLGTLAQGIALVGKQGTTAFAQASAGAQGLAKAMTFLTSPAGLAITAITALGVAVVMAMQDAEKETKKAFENMGNSASDFVSGIATAQSHLSEFNRELFVSSEQQQELEQEMREIQKGITNICKVASEERREYTQEEIMQLEEYFERLRELNRRELEIQESIATAISQQAVTNAETFQGSLEEYKIQSQEWIKTAQDQKDKTIQLINKQTTEEVALLNQRFGTEANMANEAYALEYNKIKQQREEKIAIASEGVAKIVQIYANGYLQRAKENDSFYSVLEEYNKKIEEANSNHAFQLENIQKNMLLTQANKNAAIRQENSLHENKMKNIWNDMYKNMSEQQEKELGVLLALISQTELYGGKLNEETQDIVDSILTSYESMPEKTKEAMKNAMDPMLTEMEKKEPSLFAKATSIAQGILNRLKQAFDIHSPSKETKKIFKYVMEGAEEGLAEEENNLYRQVTGMSKKLLQGFEKVDISAGLGNISGNLIDSTKNIYTTPQIVFNVQELDEGKLQQCFDYVNRKFGTSY